ncbi:TIGR00730 family Rossman fold protein [Fretibacter rubidus]|uniref:LOG family protein n=1 Tax=Fretibacter rubidus TaxID=570162 RepID=UPI00352A79C4
MTSKPSRSICVFCGSSDGDHPRYIQLAQDTGTALAEHNYRLVYGGGGMGLMGATARAAAAAGGDVLGIIPEFLKSVERLLEEVEHKVVDDMATRKKLMYEAADAFIVLPGGIGTLEEAIEVMSWMRLQLHQKPMVFMDNDGYWAPLTDLLHHTIDRGFSPKWMADDVYTAQTPAQALRLIETEWATDKPLREIAPVTLDKM